VRNTIEKLFLRYGRSLGPLAGLLLLCIGLWIATPHFLTWNNLANVLQQSTVNAILALGMTFVILTAGIDLSVGSVLAFAGVVAAWTMQAGMPAPVGVLTGIVVGTACGTVNGLLISIGRLPPFIVTLGMMGVARGAALMFADARPISGFSESFRWIARGDFLYLSNFIWILIILYVIAFVTLRLTRFGRYTYAIGGNEQAALLSGVPVKYYKTMIYALSGLTAGIAAVLLTARLDSATPNAGEMYELDAIAATVIGGTSLMGGEGNVLGTLVGALIIGVLRNGLNLLAISSNAQSLVIGAVIVISALLDVYIKSHKAMGGAK
jgi:ribose/xylose/arabinose/galactoside ABC-type transport system permease subunit